MNSFAVDGGINSFQASSSVVDDGTAPFAMTSLLHALANNVAASANVIRLKDSYQISMYTNLIFLPLEAGRSPFRNNCVKKFKILLLFAAAWEC